MIKLFAIMWLTLFVLAVLGFSGIAMQNPPDWIFAITKFMFALRD